MTASSCAVTRNAWIPPDCVSLVIPSKCPWYSWLFLATNRVVSALSVEERQYAPSRQIHVLPSDEEHQQLLSITGSTRSSFQVPTFIAASMVVLLNRTESSWSSSSNLTPSEYRFTAESIEQCIRSIERPSSHSEISWPLRTRQIEPHPHLIVASILHNCKSPNHSMCTKRLTGVGVSKTWKAVDLPKDLDRLVPIDTAITQGHTDPTCSTVV